MPPAPTVKKDNANKVKGRKMVINEDHKKFLFVYNGVTFLLVLLL